MPQPCFVLFFTRPVPVQFRIMKIGRIIYQLYELLIGADKAGSLRLLHQQRQLLATGIEVWAEIVQVSMLPKMTGTLQQAHLSIKLKRLDGSFLYTNTKTLISLNKIPQQGQTLRIRYLPDDLSAIMLM